MKSPTLNDLAFGKIAAGICLDHNVQVAKAKWDGKCLSEKIAIALKKFRATKRAEKETTRRAKKVLGIN